MAEESFPVLEQPMTDVQWGSVTLGIGNGTLDQRGNPYNLVNVSNIDNTVTIRVDTKTGFNHSLVQGFYHRMDSDIKVQVPAVSAETTYYIVLCYDPQNAKMPVSLKNVKSLDHSNGKEYEVLWEIKRKANQLLTDATFTKRRPTIVPYIQVDYADSLPDASSVLFGTRAHCLYTGETWRASYTRWMPDSPRIVGTWEMPGWELYQQTKGIMLTPVQGGYFVNWSIGILRLAGSYLCPPTFTDGGGATSTAGTPIPPEFRPTQNVYCTVASGAKIFAARLTPEGKLQLRSTTGKNETIYTKNGFDMQFQWYTDESPTARA